MKKSYIHMHARGSGRTQRMFREVAYAAMTEKVLVICSSPSEVQNNGRGFSEFLKQNHITVRHMPEFKTVDQIGFNKINWKQKQVEGYKNTFIDHHVWAKNFDFVIEGFHEYDNHLIVHKWQENIWE